MILFRKENDEVLYSTGKHVMVSYSDIAELKRLALLNPRQRIRLCSHASALDAGVQEMLIVHMKGCFVAPHKHTEKSESMLVLEGEADLILFNEDGTLREKIPLGESSSGKVFYHRMPRSIYHSLVIHTEFFVFHEITEGPFVREQTVFPDWKENYRDRLSV